MEFSNLYALITLALSLGIVHALDADHIMAISALTSANNNSRNNIHFCMRWAIGHGATLIIIGCCVYLLGMAIPDQVSHYAEHTVGLALIIIGLYLLFTLRQKKLHIHFHKHDGLPEHAHWHSHQRTTESHAGAKHQSILHRSDLHQHSPHHHNHSAVMVGVLHGAAGSAPLLVLLPIAQLENPAYGIIYLIIFSLAVLCCMALFGGLLDFIYQQVFSRGKHIFKLLRMSVAFGTIAVGCFLLVGV